jgi:hypothetical protein
LGSKSLSLTAQAFLLFIWSFADKFLHFCHLVKISHSMKLQGRVTMPKAGETRVKTAFAWLPSVAGEQLVWLERYEILEAYAVSQMVVVVAEKPVSVTFGEWKVVSTRLKQK